MLAFGQKHSAKLNSVELTILKNSTKLSFFRLQHNTTTCQQKCMLSNRHVVT